MKIENAITRTILIRDIPSLDPVTVVFRDESPGRGEIIVECYGKAWAAFWGAMGNKTVREFVASCDADYIANKLWRDGEKRTNAGEAYLLRITTAIKNALKDPPCAGNLIANIPAIPFEPGVLDSTRDNLAIVIASYFEHHDDRPANDPPSPESESWGTWTIEKTNSLLDRIAQTLSK